MARSPKAEVEISAHSRGLGAQLREARAKFGTFGAELKKHVFGKDMVEKGFWGKGGAQMMGNLGSSAVSSAVGFMVDQAKAAMSFEDSLVRLQIAARKSPEEMRAFGDSVKQSSKETGIGADKIMAAAHAYVALTGDMDGAAASSAQWARVAQATNSQVSDIAQTAAALKQNLKIKPGEMEASFSALAVQGKEGAIELKDLAAQLSSIAPQWAQFGKGTGVQGLKELGAALQVVKQGFGGDAGETVTGLQSMLSAFQKNEKNFRKKGVKIYEADGKTLRNVLAIVKDIGNAKFKNASQLQDAFGRVEAYRAYLQLSQNKELLDNLISKAGDTNVIARDFATYMNSPAGKMAQATERMKLAIQEAFTPERIEMFASAVERVAGLIEGAASSIGNAMDFWKGETLDQSNPFEAAPPSWDPYNIVGSIRGDDPANADSSSYLEKGRDILARKNRTDRVREAVQAANAPDEGRAGSKGIREAGKWAIDRLRISPDERARVEQQIKNDALKQGGITAAPGKEELTALVATLQGLTRVLEKSDGRPITVKADGNKIVDVQRGASSHRGRPGG